MCACVYVKTLIWFSWEFQSWILLGLWNFWYSEYKLLGMFITWDGENKEMWNTYFGQRLADDLHIYLEEIANN